MEEMGGGGLKRSRKQDEKGTLAEKDGKGVSQYRVGIGSNAEEGKWSSLKIPVKTVLENGRTKGRHTENYGKRDRKDRGNDVGEGSVMNINGGSAVADASDMNMEQWNTKGAVEDHDE